MLDIWDLMVRVKNKTKQITKLSALLNLESVKNLIVLIYNDINSLIVKLHCVIGKTDQKVFSF